MRNAIGPKVEQISLVHTALEFEELVVKAFGTPTDICGMLVTLLPRAGTATTGEGTLFQLTETQSGLGLELSLGVGLELKVYGAGSRVEGSRLRAYGVGF